jgi:hypothetical protein
MAGFGDAKVVNTESIKARVAGSGDVDYKRNPENKDNKASRS